MTSLDSDDPDLPWFSDMAMFVGGVGCNKPDATKLLDSAAQAQLLIRLSREDALSLCLTDSSWMRAGALQVRQTLAWYVFNAPWAELLVESGVGQLSNVWSNMFSYKCDIGIVQFMNWFTRAATEHASCLCVYSSNRKFYCCSSRPGPRVTATGLFSTLPVEMVDKVLSYLEIRDLFRLAMTCAAFFNLLEKSFT